MQSHVKAMIIKELRPLPDEFLELKNHIVSTAVACEKMQQHKEVDDLRKDLIDIINSQSDVVHQFQTTNRFHQESSFTNLSESKTELKRRLAQKPAFDAQQHPWIMEFCESVYVSVTFNTACLSACRCVCCVLIRVVRCCLVSKTASEWTCRIGPCLIAT